MRTETKLKEAFTTEDFDTVIKIMTKYGFKFEYTNANVGFINPEPTRLIIFKHPKKKYHVYWYPDIKEIDLGTKANFARERYREYDEINFHSVLYEDNSFDILKLKRDIDWINSGAICHCDCDECDIDCAELCEEEFYSTKDRISDDFNYLKKELNLSEEKLSLLKQALDYKEED